MKIMAILLALILATSTVYAASDEIILTPIAQPSITKVVLDTLIISRIRNRAEVAYRYLDSSGNEISEGGVAHFTGAQYTQLLNGLDINITFLKNAVKTKLNVS